MTILQRRRFSAFFDSFKSISLLLKPSDNKYRSLSTGDLATPRLGYSSDFVEMDFAAHHPTTSSFPAHFDDCDRVPMSFSKSGHVKLMNQASSVARKLARSGSEDDLSKAKLEDIHRTQSWFFVDVDARKAERILMSNGLIENSFLISFHRRQYVLSIWRGSGAQHLRIRHVLKKNGNLAFELDMDKTFKNLVELTEHYKKNKGYVLSSKLSKGVSRPIVRSRA